MPEQDNKALVRRLVEEVWNGRNASKIHEFFAERLHAEIAQHHRELVEAFPVLRVAIDDPPGLIADGPYVAMRLTVSGTHDGAPFAGAPPSGRELSWGSLRIFRIQDGKVTETWAMQDRLGIMQQLGLVTGLGADVHWGAEPQAR